MKTEIQEFQEEQGKWADKAFGGQLIKGKIAHLIKEANEIADNPTDIMEYADCFMLLLDSARLADITADEVLAAAWEKLAINKTREWGKPNKDGSVEHVRNLTA